MPRAIVVKDTAESKLEVAIHEYELPPLHPHEIRIQTAFSALKHGTERSVTAGDGVLSRRRTKQWDPELRLFLPIDPETQKQLSQNQDPQPVGNISVGTVIEVGSAVTRYAVGDQVFGYMPVREIQQVHQDHVRPLGTLDPIDAVCADPGHVAFVSLRDGNVRLGDRVAIFGLGAIGLMTVQMARAAGASTVIAVDPIEKRRQVAMSMGADAHFDPTACDVALEIKKITDRQGVDVAIETSGSSRALNDCIRSIMQCGTVVHVAMNQGPAKDLMLGEEWHLNRPTLVGSQAVWDNPDRSSPLWNEARARDAVVQLLQKGVVTGHGIVDPIVDFDHAVEAVREVFEDPSVGIKLGIRF